MLLTIQGFLGHLKKDKSKRSATSPKEQQDYPGEPILHRSKRWYTEESPESEKLKEGGQVTLPSGAGQSLISDLSQGPGFGFEIDNCIAILDLGDDRSFIAFDPLLDYMRVGAGDRSQLRVGEDDAVRICAVHVECALVQRVVP
jgi:hypothetical protein